LGQTGLLDKQSATRVAQMEWDYIIVGGGTAGCVLANRLTAGTGKRVLVLEAGGADFNNVKMRIPAGVLDLFQTGVDWNFCTENEPVGHGIYLCRGKIIGGSSQVNVMLYNRGDASDYNRWACEYGVSGWAADDLLPYFKLSEDNRTGLAESDPRHHSRGGEWKVDDVRYQNVLSRCFLKACEEAGFLRNNDFNDWSRPQEGVGRFNVSQCNGERCSAASALLNPALADASRQLTVLCGAQVNRIDFNGSKTATGVMFSADGVSHFARLVSGGEVLLCSGALQSPHLLMLSGVGPRKHLAEHGISVVSDLAGVGENLQDHPAVNVAFECPSSKCGVSPTSHCTFIFGRKIPHPLWILRWFLTKSGPLTSPGCDHGGFFCTSEGTPGSSPDLQMRFLPARAVTADGMNSFATFRDVRHIPDGFSFQSIAVRPSSRGRVRLTSGRASDRPLVEGNYLSDQHDIQVLRRGVRLARKLSQQPAFKSFLGTEVFPGPGIQTDAELDNYIKETVHTANALVGTCRMGKPGEPGTVCDAHLNVLGVHGLRVCDASVMPLLPGGQTGAPTVVIAERAADIILGRQRV